MNEYAAIPIVIVILFGLILMITRSFPKFDKLVEMTAPIAEKKHSFLMRIGFNSDDRALEGLEAKAFCEKFILPFDHLPIFLDYPTYGQGRVTNYSHDQQITDEMAEHFERFYKTTYLALISMPMSCFLPGDIELYVLPKDLRFSDAPKKLLARVKPLSQERLSSLLATYELSRDKSKDDTGKIASHSHSMAWNVASFISFPSSDIPPGTKAWRI